MKMSMDRIVELLTGPHQAVISLSRADRGPVAVPISYDFTDGRFALVTSPDSDHGRMMVANGRATLTVQFEKCDGRTVDQWYVTAEGPVKFSDADPNPHIRAMLIKDRGPDHIDKWLAGAPHPDSRVAVLEPERLSGYEFHDSIDR